MAAVLPEHSGSPAVSSPSDSLWPAPVSRSSQRSAKKFAVLHAAARLFCEQGFHAAALDDVAARLQVSKPTLYYYVRSKRQLVAACAAQGLENALQAVNSAQPEQPPAALLRACLSAYADVVATDFGWCMVRAAEVADAGVSSPVPVVAQAVQARVPGEVANMDWLLNAIHGIACTGGRVPAASIQAQVDALLDSTMPFLCKCDEAMQLEPMLPEVVDTSSPAALEFTAAPLITQSLDMPITPADAVAVTGSMPACVDASFAPAPALPAADLPDAIQLPALVRPDAKKKVAGARSAKDSKGKIEQFSLF